MEVFKYDPIDLGRPAFRLLRLLKGEGLDIHGEIFDAWFDLRESVVSYEALSYTWGSTDVVDSIRVKGQRLGISRNLYVALQHICLQNQDRIVWVDAICIDQSNAKERGHQVQQMGRIYKQADGVIFWLGQATYETNIIMDSLRQLQEESYKHVCKSWKRTDQRWMDLWAAAQPTLRSRHLNLPALQREGLEALLSRSWFRRVWILQEVANAQAALVYCGTKSVRARFFALGPLLIGIKPDPHCQAVLDIMPGPSRNDSWWSQSRELYTLLKNFGNSEAHDSRDMIYALLGMSSDAKDCDALRADYGKSVQELIRDVSHFLYFCDLDPALTEQLGTIRDLLLQLRILNNIAVERLLESFDEEDLGILVILLRRGDIEIANVLKVAAKLLLEEDADIESRSNVARTLLSLIPENGPEVVMRQLHLEKGSNTDLKDRAGQAPLTLTVTNGHKAVLQLLLDKGAGIESKNRSGQTLMSWSAQKGYVSVLQLLVDEGANIKSRDKDGRTPLSHATREGHDAVVRLLLENGADVESKDKDGRTPLSHAAVNGHEGIAKLLLGKGSNIESKDKDSRTPLWHAAREGHKVIVQLLLDQGADFKSEDLWNLTPISSAAREGHEVIVRLLLENGANVKSKDDHDWTPLSWAAREGREAVAKLLLEKGADVESKAKNGQTPLSWAAREGHEAVAKMLFEKGADIESKDIRNLTPLSHAAREGHEVIVRLLLEKGADTESKSDNSKTPLSWAAKYRRGAIVKLLLENGAEAVVKRPRKSQRKSRKSSAISRRGLKNPANHDITATPGSTREH